MIAIFRYYMRYIMWIAVIAFFAYIFEIIYASGAWNYLMTFFVVTSLGFVLYVTR